jgi:hypothetical protein
MKKPDHRQDRFRLALTDNGVTTLLLGLVPSVRKAAPHVKVRLTPTDAQVNNARLFLEGTSRPESFYDFGGAIKSITCLSFRR